MRIEHVAVGNHSAEFTYWWLKDDTTISTDSRDSTSVTLVSGKDARNHLNRMLTLDISKDSYLTRRESLICDLNGRITSHQLHADLGEQILLLHHESISENLRRNLTSGIPWNEEIQISSGGWSYSSYPYFR